MDRARDSIAAVVRSRQGKGGGAKFTTGRAPRIVRSHSLVAPLDHYRETDRKEHPRQMEQGVCDSTSMITHNRHITQTKKTDHRDVDVMCFETQPTEDSTKTNTEHIDRNCVLDTQHCDGETLKLPARQIRDVSVHQVRQLQFLGHLFGNAPLILFRQDLVHFAWPHMMEEISTSRVMSTPKKTTSLGFCGCCSVFVRPTSAACDLLGNLVYVLRLDHCLEAILKDAREVSLQFTAAEVCKNFLPIRWRIELAEVWLQFGSKHHESRGLAFRTQNFLDDS